MAAVENTWPHSNEVDRAQVAPLQNTIEELHSTIEELQRENKKLQESIEKRSIEDGAGEDIFIVKHEPIYVALDDVQPLLRVNQVAVLILGIGGSFLTAYLSQGDLLKILCGVLLVSVAILMDYICVNKKIKELERKKEKRRTYSEERKEKAQLDSAPK